MKTVFPRISVLLTDNLALRVSLLDEKGEEMINFFTDRLYVVLNTWLYSKDN